MLLAFIAAVPCWQGAALGGVAGRLQLAACVPPPRPCAAAPPPAAGPVWRPPVPSQVVRSLDAFAGAPPALVSMLLSHATLTGAPAPARPGWGAAAARVDKCGGLARRWPQHQGLRAHCSLTVRRCHPCLLALQPAIKHVAPPRRPQARHAGVVVAGRPGGRPARGGVWRGAAELRGPRRPGLAPAAGARAGVAGWRAPERRHPTPLGGRGLAG